MSPAEQYEMLVDSLRLLAASAADQLRALPEFVVATDEIVSTFDDAFLLVAQLERAGIIDKDAGAALRAVDQWLDSSPEDESLADASTLHTHEYWARARSLASDVLRALGEEVRPPRLGQVRWLPADK